MKVFISWSGPRSKALAETLSAWLCKVIQAVDPWISTDIEKGARWSTEIADQLEQSKVGIICLTPENVDAPWILFEAGALSKTKGAHVCTFLLGLQAADIKTPLGQFQHTSGDKSEMFDLVKTINTEVGRDGGRSLPDSVLKETFDSFWPDLAKKMEAILNQDIGEKQKPRPEREILEEILEIVRNQDRRLAGIEGERKSGDIARAIGTASTNPYLNHLLLYGSENPVSSTHWQATSARSLAAALEAQREKDKKKS